MAGPCAVAVAGPGERGRGGCCGDVWMMVVVVAVVFVLVLVLGVDPTPVPGFH